MQGDEERIIQRLEGFLTAQRAFLLSLPALFKAIQHPEQYPNIDLNSMYKDAWGGAWDCNHMIAETLGLTPSDPEEIVETAINEVILEQEVTKDDNLERLAELE